MLRLVTKNPLNSNFNIYGGPFENRHKQLLIQGCIIGNMVFQVI